MTRVTALAFEREQKWLLINTCLDPRRTPHNRNGFSGIRSTDKRSSRLQLTEPFRWSFGDGQRIESAQYSLHLFLGHHGYGHVGTQGHQFGLKR